MQNLSRPRVGTFLLTLKNYEYSRAFEMSRKKNDINWLCHFRHNSRWMLKRIGGFKKIMVIDLSFNYLIFP
jgi:hypothetical protein